MKKSVLAVYVFIFLIGIQVSSRADSSGGGILVIDINRAVGIAIENSFELKEIMAREDIYALAIDENFRQYFPTVTFSYMQTDEVKIRDEDSRQSKLSVDTEFIVFDGGKRSLNYDVAKLNALLASNDYRIALNKLIMDVRSSYLELLRLKETVKIYSMTLDMGNMQLAFIRKEHELGDATKLAVMEIEAKIREVELSLKGVQDEYESSLKQFKLMLRIDWRVSIDVTGDVEKDFLFIPPENLDEDEMISLALRNRKELESSRLKCEISRRNMEIAENYYMPGISVGFNYSLTGEDFPPHEKGWGVNIKVTTDIFGCSGSGGAGYTEGENSNSRAFSRNIAFGLFDNMQYRRIIAESRIDSARSDDEMNATVESISIEIVNSCQSIRNAWEMISIARSRYELYNSQLEIEKLKADMGESRRYDLVEKEIEWSKAAVSLLESRIRYLMAMSVLDIATGSDSGFIRNYLKGKGNNE